MAAEPSDDLPSALPDSPGAVLDALRARADWTERQRDAVLGRLVARFPADAVVEAARARLGDLGGPDAEALLRLVEAHPRPDLLAALAEAVEAQPGLRPERAWDALAVLDGAGVLDDYPALVDRWDELNEALDDGGSAEQLVEQIEGDPEGVWLALQGLGAVEPEVRPQIVAGLVRGSAGPGLVDFLRLLAYAHDPATRAAALDALSAVAPGENPDAAAAWLDLAEHHPDRSVAEAARRKAGPNPLPARQRPAPRLARSLVTAVDGLGRASVVLSAVVGETRATAAFLCDVEAGVREVFGDVTPESPRAGAGFEEFVGRVDRDAVEGAHPLALGLLAGCLTLCGPETPPAFRYWVEATAGSDFRPHPFRAEFPGGDPAGLPLGEAPDRARAVLDACPDWLDASPLTYELAEEIALREGDAPPDPRRDAGAYRFLFEHRLQGQLERYRRMLLWMAWFWRSSGRADLALGAMALASQLSDAQHVVPGHPFTVALTTRSLAAAQADLKRGVDPRRSARP